MCDKLSILSFSYVQLEKIKAISYTIAMLTAKNIAS